MNHDFSLVRFPAIMCLTFLALATSQVEAFGQGFNNGFPTSTNAGSWAVGWNGSGWGSSNWPGQVGTRNSWTLGVTGKNTNVGVMVDSVSPNSAAMRIGLSAGDLIVCVAGVQVGSVGSKIFDMAEELNRHADSSGRVGILVQFRRTGQLQTIPVQLDNDQAGLSGTLMIQNGSLPSNSIITVQLQNESRPYFAIRGGQQTFRTPAVSQGTIPFSINFDPQYISPIDHYSVHAFVTYNGNTIYQTTQPSYVLTQGNPGTVRLLLSARSMPFPILNTESVDCQRN